jgi:threonine dehydrogenase-like Zn-dependent dehydrogenase
MRWMGTGEIDCTELLTHRFPLDAYREAFATALDKRKHHSIKVAFQMTG